jgi:hypothetical protein
MEAIANKSKINDTLDSLREFSFNEKKSPLIDEERVNALLDAILELKKSIKVKAERIYSINERLESITWFDDLDEENLMAINDLISTAKDLHSSLIRQYVSLNNAFHKNGIAREESKMFKNSIDELKEIYGDLESVFFFLPKMPDFVDTTKQLSLV